MRGDNMTSPKIVLEIFNNALNDFWLIKKSIYKNVFREGNIFS